MLYRIILFLVLNFGALAIGGIFTKSGVPSEWYQNLNKAPWTPPGWVFGFAWSLIMVFLTVFMHKLTAQLTINKTLLMLYAIQLVLNIGWNPVFFHYHEMGWGLVMIVLLTVIVGMMIYLSNTNMSIWLLPYFLWLIIATSLNFYSWYYN